MVNTSDTYITIEINTNMESLIKSGVGIKVMNNQNEFYTTIYEDRLH